jgi:probable phosphoglycerate mutase
MQLILVRHGEPEWTNERGTVVDPRLTERGRAQAGHAADHLAGPLAEGGFDRVLVSPLRRARETAEPIVDRLATEAEVLPFLAEIGIPAWEGEPAEYVERVFAEQRLRPVEALWDGLDGAESFHDFHDRVTGGWQDLLAGIGVTPCHDQPKLYRIDEPDQRIVTVAHGGTNAVTIATLLGIPPVPWEWERFVSYHASVTVIESSEISGAHAFTLRRLSDLSHLPSELHTV